MSSVGCEVSTQNSLFRMSEQVDVAVDLGGAAAMPQIVEGFFHCECKMILEGHKQE